MVILKIVIWGNPGGCISALRACEGPAFLSCLLLMISPKLTSPYISQKDRVYLAILEHANLSANSPQFNKVGSPGSFEPLRAIDDGMVVSMLDNKPMQHWIPQGIYGLIVQKLIQM